MKRVVEEEGLDHPKDSVEFLEYVKNHDKKTRHHRHRLHKCSKILMVVGAVMLGYMVVRHMVHKRNMHRIENHQQENEYSGRNHRLGASAQVEDDTAYGKVLSTISVAMWGLVVAKAKAGVEAAQKEDAQSIGASLKKIGMFCSLVAGASLLQMMGAANTTNPVEAVKSATRHAKLQSEHHPASYYDENSSHYQGGAHNVFMNAVKLGNIEEPTPQFGHEAVIHAAKQLKKGKTPIMDKQPEFGHEAVVHLGKNLMSGKISAPSARSMGGAHNVAMAVLTEQSNQYKKMR
jgi:hypothetical protein